METTNKSKIICPVCDKEYQHQSRLDGHIKTKHPEYWNELHPNIFEGENLPDEIQEDTDLAYLESDTTQELMDSLNDFNEAEQERIESDIIYTFEKEMEIIDNIDKPITQEELDANYLEKFFTHFNRKSFIVTPVQIDKLYRIYYNIFNIEPGSKSCGNQVKYVVITLYKHWNN